MKRPADIVYVLDDDPAAGAMVGLVAEHCGLGSQVFCCASGLLAALTAQPPSHVVLDLMMPEVDGIEVLQRLGAMRSRAGVIITAAVGRRVMEAAERLARDQGLDLLGTLPKPVETAALRAMLLRKAPAGTGTPAASRQPAAPPITPALLSDALTGGELGVVYQPKISCGTGLAIGVETLAAWQRPDGTRVPPELFVTLAEQSGLIEALTERVVVQALDWYRALACPDLSMALNISTRSLEDRAIVEWLAQLCLARGIAPDRVVLEMTETAAMRDPTATLDVLTRFRLRGFRVSIDDFGVGYSSIAQLARLPFSELKVDRAFVKDLGMRGENRSIVRAITGLGHSLGLVVAAEGVEDAAALDFLREIGCDHAQGYHIAPPLAPQSAAAWLRTQPAGLA